MRGALISARPPQRIALATIDVGAPATLGQSGNAARKEANDRDVLISDVCCESTVAMSSSSGGPLDRQVRFPYRDARRDAISANRDESETSKPGATCAAAVMCAIIAESTPSGARGKDGASNFDAVWAAVYTLPDAEARRFVAQTTATHRAAHWPSLGPAWTVRRFFSVSGRSV